MPKLWLFSRTPLLLKYLAFVPLSPTVVVAPLACFPKSTATKLRLPPRSRRSSSCNPLVLGSRSVSHRRCTSLFVLRLPSSHSVRPPSAIPLPPSSLLVEPSEVRTFKGHTNEKNFVGLTVINDYIACGSETNEVFVYHKEISKPVTWHRFGSLDIEDAGDEAGSYFISVVCWKSDSLTILTANSQGTIKVLVLAA